MNGAGPRHSEMLVGHQAALDAMLSGWRAGRLAHGWLISGARGTGKATLAYHFARAVLSGDAPEDLSPQHPVFRRVAAGSHTDLLVVEPVFDTEKNERARDISAQQAREIPQFLSLTAAESAWRVVMIDAVDDLTLAGANALLKILEEPPGKSVILLICHVPGRLLPTIRSRCRLLRLNALNHNEFNRVMRQVSPELDRDTLAGLRELSDGSPGVAVALQEAGALALYGEMVQLLAEAPPLDTASLYRFAEKIAGMRSQEQRKLFTALALALLSRVARTACGRPPAPVSGEEGLALAGLSRLHAPPVWAGKWQQAAEQFLLAERLHLDYKQVLLLFFHSLLSAEGFQIGSTAA